MVFPSPRGGSEQLTPDTTAPVLCRRDSPQREDIRVLGEGQLVLLGVRRELADDLGGEVAQPAVLDPQLVLPPAKTRSQSCGYQRGAAPQPSHPLLGAIKPGFPCGILAKSGFIPALRNASTVAPLLSLPGRRAQFGPRTAARGSFSSATRVMGMQGLPAPFAVPSAPQHLRRAGAKHCLGANPTSADV